MDVIAISIERFIYFLLTEAVCIGFVLSALVGLVILALVLGARDTIPDRETKKTLFRCVFAGWTPNREGYQHDESQGMRRLNEHAGILACRT
jgi:hypothetical protein